MAPADGVLERLGEGVRLSAGCPNLGGEFVWLQCLGALGYPPPLLAHTRCPAPQDSKGAPQKACQADAPSCTRIGCCATAVRHISKISTTSARRSATVCQCRRRDVAFASGTRMGPGRGSMFPQGREGPALGGGVPSPEVQASVLGTGFAQVELHRKIDVCTQLHLISVSCTELHCSCTVQYLCNCAGSAVATAAVVAAS